ncbi:cyanophycinase [Marivirga sericea]|uniref:Cyanophycinase n=1 Tax=Marivirga sericea TaxID=1028 RepID=A0A1X7JQB9_9BACT|nr:cyanophycinase [Marivirga sericea]SMG30219.1 cyanophycinase [Marivirga sericea]
MRELFLFIIISTIFSCQTKQGKESSIENLPEGGLFVIGGGSRPSEMIDKLIELANLKEGYGYILPMASADDSAYYYANKQFAEKGLADLKDYTKGQNQLLDSIENASLIYMAGGDQRRLMEVLSEPERIAIRKAYEKGAIIAGTSAGAAVMSKKMITGDEKKHPEYHPTFRTIEKDNIIFDEGLGLLPDKIIIDQHFIYRSRYNRLLTAVLEVPDHIGFGIDESTALFIQDDSATVVGEWQVVSFRNSDQQSETQNTLLGAKNIELNIYLPNEKFKFPQ